MKRIALAVVLIASIAPCLNAQSAPDAAELTRLLKEFLDGASRNDAAVHDRFWAEDLIYTGSSGRRIGKADIMRDQRSPRAPRSEDSSTTYSAEDIRIQQYENTAIVAFRLVAVTKREGNSETSSFLNSGTFLKREGKWQAVSWQSTRMLKSEEQWKKDDEAKKNFAVTEAAFREAVLAADTNALNRLSHASFFWSRNGEELSLKRFLQEVGSGRLKISKIENEDVTVSSYGETAEATGVARIQRASIPNKRSDNANPTEEYYIHFLKDRDGTWKAISMGMHRR
jgi:ketosteroid isomerase-like protein